MKEIGLQLYSIAHETSKDFGAALKKVAATGFKTIEFAGYGNIDAKTMKSMLDELGLNAVSSHTGMVFDNLDWEIEYLNTVGAKHIVLPALSMANRNEVLSVTEKMNKIGEKCKANGLIFSYHNHSHEFIKDENGEYYLDVLYSNTDPEYVKMQLDVCWAVVGGVDPVEYLKKYPGRCLICHMKDVKNISPYEGTAVGLGIVNFKGIVNTLGQKVDYIVEQEGISMDCWEGLAQSVKYLSEL